jgi:hypothetical protein
MPEPDHERQPPMPRPRFNIKTLMLVVLFSALVFGLAASLRSLMTTALTTTITTTPIDPTTGRPLPAGR